MNVGFVEVMLILGAVLGLLWILSTVLKGLRRGDKGLGE